MFFLCEGERRGRDGRERVGEGGQRKRRGREGREREREGGGGRRERRRREGGGGRGRRGVIKAKGKERGESYLVQEKLCTMLPVE